MTELVTQFIGKDCIIYTMDAQVPGVLESIEGGWMKVNNGGKIEVLNLDYIVRIKEYPVNKEGKKKKIVF